MNVLRILRSLVFESGGTDVDDPALTAHRKRLIREKPLLARFYQDAYAFFLAERAGTPNGIELELGSGGGHLREVLPDVVTSDVLAVDDVQRRVDAMALPYADASLRAIYMLDVFHHIPNVESFLTEAQRTLRPGGKIIMIEPSNTAWASMCYRAFHQEPYDPTATDWTLPPGGPLSMANIALPWIVFERDLSRFQGRFPGLVLRRRECFGPWLYLLSGGLSVRQLVPSLTLPAVVAVEALTRPLHRWTGMFMKIVVERQVSP